MKSDVTKGTNYSNDKKVSKDLKRTNLYAIARILVIDMCRSSDYCLYDIKSKAKYYSRSSDHCNRTNLVQTNVLNR